MARPWRAAGISNLSYLARGSDPHPRKHPMTLLDEYEYCLAQTIGLTIEQAKASGASSFAKIGGNNPHTDALAERANFLALNHGDEIRAEYADRATN